MIKKSISVSVAAAFAVCSLALNAGFFATPVVAPDAPTAVSAAPTDQSTDALVAKGSDSPVVVLASNAGASIVVPRTAVSDSPFVESKLSETEFIADGERYPLREYKPFITPNDPAATQWWTTATGLPAAWDYGSSANTTIAVIDSGFALDHQEFVGRWAERAGEKGAALLENPSDRNCTDRGLPVSAICNNIDDDQDGITDNESGATSEQNPSRFNCTDRGLPLDKSCNLIDDDGNGYPDDWRGWDFASGDAFVQAGEVYPDGDGASHGTSVVGVAAATGNNGVGIAGVNWSAKILPLQALGDDGSGNTLSVSRAIRYAADQGVDVINLSLGSNFEDSYLRQAVQYAFSKGAVVVAASGNDGCDCISYPANYPEVVAVGATRSDGSVAGFSSYGDNLDIAAPGSGMYLPAWYSANQTAGYANGMAGTSFSAPYVSGLLASARSKQPNATWGQLVGMLRQTSDRRTLTAAAPFSRLYGSGYARADSLMQRVGNAYQQSSRYAFRTSTSDVLGSATAQECEAGNLPATPFYEITKSGNVFYSISELTADQQRRVGAAVTRKAYMCVGLPTDQITFFRVMDPARELSNSQSKL